MNKYTKNLHHRKKRCKKCVQFYSVVYGLVKASENKKGPHLVVRAYFVLKFVVSVGVARFYVLFAFYSYTVNCAIYTTLWCNFRYKTPIQISLTFSLTYQHYFVSLSKLFMTNGRDSIQRGHQFSAGGVRG